MDYNAMVDNTAKLREIGKPFVKGADPRRNLAGRRPKTHCLTSASEALHLGVPEDVVSNWKNKQKGKLTGAQRAAIALFKAEETGNVQAYKEASDRIEGKVKDLVDMTSNGGSIGQTTIVVESAEAKKEVEALLKGE